MEGAPPAEGESPHVLLGRWSLLWLSLNRSHDITITHVFASGGMTNIVGSATGDFTGECQLTGYIIDELIGELRDGFDIRTIPVTTLVRLRIRCAAEEIHIDAFGLPEGPILMSGRAMLLMQDGSRRIEAVALGRPQVAETPSGQSGGN